MSTKYEYGEMDVYDVHSTARMASCGGSDVIPNPVLAGDEPELTGIQIDGDKFKVGGGSGLPTGLLSVERLGDYLYKATFDSVPEFVPGNESTPGACTSFVKDGKLYRNLDWRYDNTAYFWTKCKTFEGMAFVAGMNDGELNLNKVAQMPYHLLDGHNDAGIMVSTHILFNDWEYDGNGEKDFPIYLLPYKILSEVTSIDNLDDQLEEYLTNISIPDTLKAQEYLLQFVVTDGADTYIIAPPTSASGAYQIIKTTNGVDKLTNFRYVPTATLARNASSLQDRPTGVERWNLIENAATLADLKFTDCYIAPDRLSEFIGIDDTDKDSTDEELEAIYDLAHTAYENRTRDGQTWQSVYSVVYSGTKIEELYAQEDFSKNYISEQGSSSTGLIVQAEDTQQVDGFDCPVLSIEQVTSAYNVLVAGGSVTVQSEDGDVQFKAQMGDATTSRPAIMIGYYWLGWVDYQITTQDSVAITVHKVPTPSTHQITSVTVSTDTIDLVIS